MVKGFDNDLYVKKQKEYIQKRIEKYNNKLYLEFGGKLFDDYHAARVLPGFDVNGKIRLLQEFKDQAEIIFCINAADIEKKKIRADFGITYDLDVMRLIDNLRKMDIYINSVVIGQYTGQPSADIFRKKLEMRGVKTYIHRLTKGYPTDVDVIVSEEGYGANPYIETTRQLVVVTAPGPGSGKLATCLSQLYHEHKRGVNAGYAKFETFPIWNIPLKHPVNVAYEAATVDLKDKNMIDPFHLEAYGETTVNYNRDIEAYPLVRNILKSITGDIAYKSPTDMGVNMAGYAIFDDEVVKEAACQEIIRRYYKAYCDYKNGLSDKDSAQKVELLMKELNITKEQRRVVIPALEKKEQTGANSAVAIELENGKIVTARSSKLMHATAGALLNSMKELAGLADDILLLSPVILEPMLELKRNKLGTKTSLLSSEEILIALSICAATSPMAEIALSKLDELKNCEAHSTSMVTQTEEAVFRKLGINLTCEPEFSTNDLYNV